MVRESLCVVYPFDSVLSACFGVLVLYRTVLFRDKEMSCCGILGVVDGGWFDRSGFGSIS